VTILSRRLIYPDGDSQEAFHVLRINDVVDLNGNPLALPLPTDRLIAYRVFKISTDLPPGEEITNYHLELLTRYDLSSLVY
jgi:hypothetical protein